MRLSKPSIIRDRRGDTIVEVMIVLAVLGLAMGISYATANRSLLNARQAQENSIATEIARSQVEGLSSIGCTSGDASCDPTNLANSGTPSYKLFQQTTPFCLNIADVGDPIKPVTDPACTVDSLYHIQITYTAPNNFTVEIIWDDVFENGHDTVIQSYTIPK